MNERPLSVAHDKKPSNSTAIIVSVSFSSAVWLFAGILLLGYLAKSPPSCVGTFSCLTLDAWGTYLSGVFAPLAFFWLVATVWIQSRELAQQREELALTRKEFEHNREVMKAQSDYVGAQTDIVVRDQADHELLMLLRLFRTWALSHLSKTEFKVPPVDVGTFTKQTPDDPIDFIVAVSGRLSHPIFMIMFLDDKDYLKEFEHLTSETVEELAEHYDRIYAMRPRVSPANSALLKQLKATVSSEDIRTVAKELPSIMGGIDDYTGVAT
ncbi:hypothetical protein ELH48_15975 [Rhizobium ruizarguesonis]|uniref:hypothetical protein n=1 Tax=Rhizobium ruizarguesonis TaxID=2081791 RepID=UPI001032632C|nr:hypothetical protein [Rhizobium ruizarguesonis]MBY5829369.1 hypothetical protein [Rhizobium leguminosarum]QJS28629.1 hypothetical protein RLTA1_15530 [Rhizobium leguminosarum bv. trifolii TA1]MBY5858034.1 hypothetical protein [Rhizobium leguminosarum]MBY5870817.1 hypothetical protein [Rhizobium leguminosarum]NEH67522.1 hypothetical protein [Rhizobium ruizarguesonis]